MKYAYLLCLAFGIILSSCSSDACADINCVRGTCENGSCLCPQGYIGDDCDTCAHGYYGENCDITDLTGSYWMTGLAFTGCEDFTNGYSETTPVEDPELCVTAKDENIFCWRVNLIINESPKTFRWVGGADWTLDGGATWREWSIVDRSGTYKANADLLVLTSADNRDYEFIISENQLTRNYQKNRFIEDCFYTETFTRSSN